MERKFSFLLPSYEFFFLGCGEIEVNELLFALVEEKKKFFDGAYRKKGKWINIIALAFCFHVVYRENIYDFLWEVFFWMWHGMKLDMI